MKIIVVMEGEDTFQQTGQIKDALEEHVGNILIPIFEISLPVETWVRYEGGGRDE